jgi:hypothetical protein
MQSGGVWLGESGWIKGSARKLREALRRNKTTTAAMARET